MDNPRRESIFSRAFLTLLLAQALFGLSFSTYFLLPKYLQTELQADPTTIGWISGAAWMTSILCVPVTGGFVDRLGRRRFQLIGSFCMVIGCCLFAVADSVGVLLV
ncbi:MAG: MFS transporter, partial [Akkermansiaceae bacterium]|nr:MFS transporter [Akkermansiaceae bacterium]